MQFIALTLPELDEHLAKAARLGAEQALKSIGTTPEVMDKKQLAKYWSRSVATIDRYMKAGLPFKKVEGGYPRFYRTECDMWMSRRGE